MKKKVQIFVILTSCIFCINLFSQKVQKKDKEIKQTIALGKILFPKPDGWEIVGDTIENQNTVLLLLKKKDGKLNLRIGATQSPLSIGNDNLLIYTEQLKKQFAAGKTNINQHVIDKIPIYQFKCVNKIWEKYPKLRQRTKKYKEVVIFCIGNIIITCIAEYNADVLDDKNDTVMKIAKSILSINSPEILGKSSDQHVDPK